MGGCRGTGSMDYLGKSLRCLPQAVDTFDPGGQFLKAKTARHLQAQLPFNIQLDDRQAEHAILPANIRSLLAIDIRQRYIGEILRHQAFYFGFNRDANAAMGASKKNERCRMQCQLLKLTGSGDGLHVDEERENWLATGCQVLAAAASVRLPGWKTLQYIAAHRA